MKHSIVLMTTHSELAARILVRGVVIGFLIACAARLGWAAGGWIIG